jgi:hypothetical protein
MPPSHIRRLTDHYQHVWKADGSVCSFGQGPVLELHWQANRLQLGLNKSFRTPNKWA